MDIAEHAETKEQRRATYAREGCYARLAEKYWQENAPNWYANQVAEGTLEQTLLDTERSILVEIQRKVGELMAVYRPAPASFLARELAENTVRQIAEEEVLKTWVYSVAAREASETGTH